MWHTSRSLDWSWWSWSLSWQSWQNYDYHVPHSLQLVTRRCDRPRWESAGEGVGQQEIQPVQVQLYHHDQNQHKIIIHLIIMIIMIKQQQILQVYICRRLYLGCECKTFGSDWEPWCRGGYVTGRSGNDNDNDNGCYVTGRSDDDDNALVFWRRWYAGGGASVDIQ